MQLTSRYYSDAIRRQLLESVERVAKGIAQAAGVPTDREPIMKLVTSDSTPPTLNNSLLTQRVMQATKGILGEENVVAVDPSMGGEDFSRYGRTPENVPICIFWLGAVSPQRAQDGGKPLPSLHPCIPVFLHRSRSRRLRLV